jgi:hypothetical protein
MSARTGPSLNERSDICGRRLNRHGSKRRRRHAWRVPKASGERPPSARDQSSQAICPTPLDGADGAGTGGATSASISAADMTCSRSFTPSSRSRSRLRRAVIARSRTSCSCVYTVATPRCVLQAEHATKNLQLASNLDKSCQ